MEVGICMKKVLACLLVMALCFSASGCSGGASDYSDEGNEMLKDIDSTYSDEGNEMLKDIDSTSEVSLLAEERTYATTGSAPKRNMGNTYAKLTIDKTLNVAYLGGSVTGGVGGSNGGWRTMTTNWFKEQFPDASVNEIYAAIGGTASFWGSFRVDSAVLQKNPDLIFVEFTVNDGYAGMKKDQSAAYMEGIIKQINAKCPNADIIIVVITDKGIVGTHSENMIAHFGIAEHYGIPIIDVGMALKAQMDATGTGWEEYSNDWVHPNDKGYKIYADEVKKQLNDWLIVNPTRADSIKPHTMPANNYTTNYNSDPTVIYAESINCGDDGRMVKSSDTLKNLSKKENALRMTDEKELTFEFEGISLGLIVETKSSGKIKVIADGQKCDTIVFNKAQCSEKVILDNLTQGKHTVTLKFGTNSYFDIGAVLLGSCK